MAGIWGAQAGAAWRGLVGERGFVGEDAVEGGAGDLELAGGAELVAAIDVEDELNVVPDDGIEGEVGGVSGEAGVVGEEGIEGDTELGISGIGEGEVGGVNDAVVGFKDGSFEDGGELANVAGPVVPEEAGEGSGAETDGALLISAAEALEQELSKGCDVFSALAQGRDGEADGGEAEGEVRQKESLAGHLAERGLGRGEHDRAARGSILEALEDAEEKVLPGRGEQVDAIEIGEAGEGGGIGVGGEPLAGVATLEQGASQGRAHEEVVGQRLLT